MDYNTKEIFKSIEYYNDYFPDDKVRELLNREDETRTLLVQYIKGFQNNIFKHLSEERYVGHIYAVMILCQFKEKELYPFFLNLLRLPGTRIYKLFDTVIPEYGGRIIATVYNGDINTILDVLNDKKANEYAKAVTIQALKILYLNGDLNKSEIEGFLIELLNGKLRCKDKAVLLEILYTAVELELNETLEVLETVCKKGEYKSVFSVDEFQAKIQLYEEGLYERTGLNNTQNQKIVDSLQELENIFALIEEKFSIKKQAQKVQDTIIEEINELSKKFKKGISSVSLEEQLNSLHKAELYDIGKNLSIKGYYRLKKDKLISSIVNNYEAAVKEKLNTFDEERIKELMLFLKSGGVRKVEKSIQFNTFFYLESYALLFPFSDDKDTYFIMPEIVRNIVKEITSGFVFRKKVKANSEIIVLLKGLLEAYGVISIDEVINKLRLYDIRDIESDIKKVINEGAGMYYSVLDKKYIVNISIDNFDIVDEVKESGRKYDYKIFSKEAIISMGKGEWIDNVSYAKEFYERFSEEFIIEKNNLTDIINDMKSDVQMVKAEDITQFMVDSLDDKCIDAEDVEELKESKKIVKELVGMFLENVPLWRYKGRTTKEVYNRD